ncbi:MAG: PIN domain-containing protein [Gemmatimonadota bacterium]|nr:PIN domain-containing protein [Gemmatimonadota bacterium]
MAVFIDTSILLGIALGEPSGPRWADRLRACPVVSASCLLEAEFHSACRRSEIPVNQVLLDDLDWISPSRPLSAEIARVQEAGYVRGADCWHLATALYLAQDPEQLTFLTLDVRQREVAAALGFAT